MKLSVFGLRQMEGRRTPSTPRPCIDIGPVIDQQFHHLLVTVCGALVDGLPSHIVTFVDDFLFFIVSTCGQYVIHFDGIALGGRFVGRLLAFFRGAVFEAVVGGGLLPSVRMELKPMLLLGTLPLDVRRKTARSGRLSPHAILIRPLVLLLHVVHLHLLLHLLLVSAGMTLTVSGGLEVHEQHGVHSTLEGIRPSVYNRMRFEQQHLPGFECNVVCYAVVIVYLARPRFVDILSDVDHGRCDEGETIDVRHEHRPLGVYAYAVHGGRTQIFAGPILQGFLGGVPYPFLEFTARSSKTFIVYGHHVGRTGPMIGVGVSRGPLFGLLIEIVLVPELLGECDDLLGGRGLEEAHVGVVLHRLWLTIAHEYAIVLVDIAQSRFARRTIMISTTLEVSVVDRLTIAQYLQGHISKLVGYFAGSIIV
mmetsp:Transcript_11983/g.35067  ORF Transcript_11983/g.35067 Transcript_11983/m.35067 type:complete len:421 (-) Transcript_11983:7-1269(-)